MISFFFFFYLSFIFTHELISRCGVLLLKCNKELFSLQKFVKIVQMHIVELSDDFR